MKAPTPFSIRCPQCNAKLSIQMPGFGLLLAAIVLIVIGMSLAVFAAWHRFGTRGLVIGTLVYFALLVALEVAIGVVFFSRATFVSKAA